MVNGTLDQWGVITPTNEIKKPLILSDAHAHYLYEQSHERMVEKMYENQIDEYLEAEKAENRKDPVSLRHILNDFRHTVRQRVRLRAFARPDVQTVRL